MMHLRNRLFVFGLFVALVGAATSPAATLDFLDTFEAYGLGTDLNGTGGWAVETNDVGVANRGLVTNAPQTAAEGSKYAAIGDATLSQQFTDSKSNVWTKIFLQPVLAEAAPSFPTNATIAMWIGTNGLINAYDAGVVTVLTHTAIATGAWSCLTFRSDYANDTWDLWLNNTQIAANLNFYTNLADNFTRFGIGSESVLGKTLVDGVSASTLSPETPTIEFTPTAVLQLEEGTPGTGTVVLSFAPSNVVTAVFARIGGTASPPAGGDFENPASFNLSFSPGIETQTFTFAINNDSGFEGNETVIWSLTNVVNATLTANSNLTYTIDDGSDAPPSNRFVETSITVLEGGSVTGHVVISFDSPNDISVNINPTGGTATAGVDYSLSETPVIIPGAGSVVTGEFIFATTDDAIDEFGSETIVIGLEDPTNCLLANFNTVLTITIDDTNDIFSLPFSEPFEARTLGNLDGQVGWMAAGTVVAANSVVNGSNTVFAGSQAGYTTNSGEATISFTDLQTNVWAELYVRPQLGNAPAFPATATAVFYFGSGGSVVAYNGKTAQTLGHTAGSNGFVRMTVNLKYTGNTYDLYMDGQQIVTNFGFYSNSVAGGFSTFGFHDSDNDNVNAYWDNVNLSIASLLGGGYRITNETTAGGDVLVIVGDAASDATYRIIAVDNDASLAKAVVNTTVNPPGGSFTYTDTGVLNDSAVTSRYYQVVEVADETTTNATTWVMQKQARRSNQWHAVAAASSYDAGTNQNALHTTLGDQLATALTGTASFAASDQLWFWNYAKNNWSNAHVNGSGEWTTAGGYRASNNIPPSAGFFVKTRAGLLRPESTNSVLVGVATTNAPVIALASNNWVLFAWPFIESELESDGTGVQQGWGFDARGGTSGETFDVADRLFAVYKDVPYDMYLGTNGRWQVKGTAVTPTVALQHGRGYFYFTRGTSFNWRATQAP